MIQEALRTHFGEPVYRPTDVGREELVAALERVHADLTSVRDWSDVQEDARCRQQDPVSSHAVSDLEHAHDYYLADTGAALGGRFLDDVDALIERIEMFPAGAPPVDGFSDLRRARLRHFPYGIFHRHDPSTDELLVLRILHRRRGKAAPLAD